MTKAELVKARIKIVGRVQGVFYRQTTKDQARALGLSGWVKNDDDGAVSAEVLGERDCVEKLIRWCHQGPPSAKVSSVDVEWQELDQVSADQHAAAASPRFEIKH